MDSQDKPIIAFSRRLGSGSRLSLASYDEVWQFIELDVDYDVGWVGVTKKKPDDESSSSSSEGTGYDEKYYVVAYDSTNSEFKAYLVASSWALVGSISGVTTSYLTTKIAMCDNKIAIAFIEDGESISYNFFDVVTGAWSFVGFNTLTPSALYGDIIDMDLEGYDTSGTERFCIGWLSGTPYWSYVNSAICLSNDTIAPTGGGNYNVEVSGVDVIASSTDYLVNGYKKIGVTLDDSGLAQLVCLGVSSKLFSLNGSWSEDVLDIEAVGNGNVFTYLDVNYFTDDDNVKMVFGCDSGDIYYLQPSTDETFPVANPEIILLNSGDYAYRVTSFSPQAGEDILGAYDNYYGRVLRDARIPLLITSNRTTSP